MWLGPLKGVLDLENRREQDAFRSSVIKRDREKDCNQIRFVFGSEKIEFLRFESSKGVILFLFFIMVLIPPPFPWM